MNSPPTRQIIQWAKCHLALFSRDLYRVSLFCLLGHTIFDFDITNVSHIEAGKPDPTTVWTVWAILFGLSAEVPNSRAYQKPLNMEEDFYLPNEHLLNLNPRPHNINKRRRRPAILDDSENALNCLNVLEDKFTLLDNEHLGTMSETSSPGTLTTRLPMPRGLREKGKGKQKENIAEVQDASPKDKWYYKSDTSPMTSEGSSAKSMDKDRDQYWRKVRGKSDKDSPSQTQGKEKQGKDKPKEYYQGAYRKLMSLASAPRNEVSKHKLRSASETNASNTKLPMRGEKSRSGIPSPSEKVRSSSGGLNRTAAVHRPGQKKEQHSKVKGQSAGSKTNEPVPKNSPEKSDNSTDSSNNSQPSTSSRSGPPSSATEWEDKFVVNMPSAKDPNPPTMTARQINEFQKSIDKVEQEGGTMVDPETSPTPRTTTPEDKVGSTDTPEKSSDREGPDPATSSNPKTGRYYSPDEVGKKRFSTIWEESPLKSKKKGVDARSDGSFLGCKEINKPEDKNPDEILHFSTTSERPKVVDVSAPISRKPRANKPNPTARRMASALEEKNLVQKEWESISRNLKDGKFSKALPKTLCQDPGCKQQEKTQAAPKAPGKENSQTPGDSTSPSSKGSQGDEVFMNTPTISHTIATAEDAKAPGQKSHNTHIPQSNSKATGENMTTSRSTNQPKPSSGLRQAAPNSRGKPDDKPKEPSVTPPKPPTMTTIPVVKNRAQTDRNIESPRGIRGFMRVPGIVKSSTENFTENKRSNSHQPSAPVSTAKGDSNSAPARSISGPPQVSQAPSSSQGVSPASSISKEESPNTRTETPSVRFAEVPELDGNQLHGEAKKKKPRSNSLDTAKHSYDGLDNPSDDEDEPYPLTLSLVFDILILSITHVQKLSGECFTNQYPYMVLGTVLRMIEHCVLVGRHISVAFSTYRSTGSWPKPGEKDLGRSLADLGQAIVYLIALGFLMIILGRAAGYVVFLGSWVVWFAKPFGWAFGLIAKALVP